MTIAVVVGNPKPDSRTLHAGILAAQKLTGSDPDLVIDVVKLGAELLGFGGAGVSAAVLRPVLVELGASCPARGLYLLESGYEDEAAWETWLQSARPFIPAAAARTPGGLP